MNKKIKLNMILCITYLIMLPLGLYSLYLCFIKRNPLHVFAFGAACAVGCLGIKLYTKTWFSGELEPWQEED